MPRTAPSAADQRLIDKLAADGFTITPSRLERWRARGLLPPVKVRREGFGGSRVDDHDDDVVGAATVLAQVSGRGVLWQESAAWLFTAGYPLSSTALQGAASWLVDEQSKVYLEAWRQAEAGLRVPDTLAAIEMVATRAVDSLDP
ncbi:MAG: hypothetical protein FWG25_05270, partial [Promicromonosporaceae bacterium]|nr:hypothetical protein [Promicromonosporaceae bacterium]